MKRFFGNFQKLKADSFTLVELLVVIAIIGMLAGITVPTVGKALDKGKLAADIGKSRTWKEIDLLVVNEINNGDTNLSQFPGLTATDLPKWYAGIVKAIGTNGAMKLFSVADVKPTSFSTNTGPDTNPYIIYATTDDTNDSVIMLTTRNWRLANASGNVLTKGVQPFGVLGATMFLKNGSAFLITPQTATNAVTNWGIVSNALN